MKLDGLSIGSNSLILFSLLRYFLLTNKIFSIFNINIDPDYDRKKYRMNYRVIKRHYSTVLISHKQSGGSK